jgi:hypothetical protein
VLLHNGMQGAAAHFESTQPAAPVPAPGAEEDSSSGDASPAASSGSEAEGSVSDDAASEDSDGAASEEGEACAPSQHPHGSLGWLVDEAERLQARLSGGALDAEEREALLRQRASVLSQIGVSGPPSGQPDWPSFKAQLAATIAALRAFAVQRVPAALGQIVMACGTGKTAVAKWVLDALAQHAGVRSVLVLVPSLQLLSQVLLDFHAREAATPRFPLAKCRVITVCSQRKVHEGNHAAPHKRGGAACRRRAARCSSEEEAEASEDDISLEDLRRSLPAGVSTRVACSARELAEFLAQANSNELTIVLSTYQSSPIVKARDSGSFRCLVALVSSCLHAELTPACSQAAHALARNHRFELGIFDEAHKTASDTAGQFATALHDANIRIDKRLFLTATQRLRRLRKSLGGESTTVLLMHDESVYGRCVACWLASVLLLRTAHSLAASPPQRAVPAGLQGGGGGRHAV